MTGVIVVAAIFIIGFLATQYVQLSKEVERKEATIENLNEKHKSDLSRMADEYWEHRKRNREELEEKISTFRNCSDPIAVEKAKYHGFLMSELPDVLDHFYWRTEIYRIDYPQFITEQVKRDVFEETLPNAFAVSFLLTVKAVYNTSDHIFNTYQNDEGRQEEDTQHILIPALNTFCKYILCTPLDNDDIAEIINYAYDGNFTVGQKKYTLNSKSTFYLGNGKIIENCVKLLFVYWLHYTTFLPIETLARTCLGRRSKTFSEAFDKMKVAANGNAYLRNYARIKSIVIKETQQTKE